MTKPTLIFVLFKHFGKVYDKKNFPQPNIAQITWTLPRFTANQIIEVSLNI